VKNELKTMSAFLACILLCGCSVFAKAQRPTANACALPKTEKAKIVKSNSTLPNTTTPALFILPGVVYQANALPEILDKFTEESPADNIVIYIHGKGDEPSKAIKEGLLSGLNIEYGLSPVMLTWASGEGVFPGKEALAASETLKKVLNELSEYKTQHADILEGKKFSLLTHSMGSLVLEGFLSKYKSGLPSGLLDTIVINAAASTVDNHAEWVEKVDFAKKVFITYGNDDPMLRLASVGIKTARLGKHGARQRGEKERVANNAIYVDVSQAIDEHRYFVGNGDLPCIYSFFNESLNGKTPDFSDRRVFTVSTPDRDYILNK
jgi:hypothetical protein